jgi:hypothetical protein
VGVPPVETGADGRASAGGRTYCSMPDGPSFAVPTPPGFNDFNDNEPLGHAYDVPRPLGCADPDSVLQGFIDDPTPGNPMPATPDGTRNNAVVLGQNNWVTSYLTTDLDTGNPIVVNMTGYGSLFANGYTVRSVSDGVAHTYGQGNNWKQSENLFPALNAYMNERIWGSQMDNIISHATSDCGCP